MIAFWQLCGLILLLGGTLMCFCACRVHSMCVCGIVCLGVGGDVGGCGV